MSSEDPERDLELSALLDGELDEASEVRLRAALARSPALLARLAELAAVDEALRAIPAPEHPGLLLEGIRRRIAAGETPPDASRAPGRRTPRRLSRWRGALLAAGAAAAGAFLLMGLPRLRGSGPADARLAQGPAATAPRGDASSTPADEAALTRLAGEADPAQLDSDLPVIGVLDVLQDLDEPAPRPGRTGRG